MTRKKTEQKGDSNRQEFKNVLPKIYPTWHNLFNKIKEDHKAALPKTVSIEIIRANKEVYVYNFDVDFVKARMFDEIQPITNELYEAVKEGKNYTRWHDLVTSFYQAYTKIKDGF